MYLTRECVPSREAEGTKTHSHSHSARRRDRGSVLSTPPEQGFCGSVTVYPRGMAVTRSLLPAIGGYPVTGSPRDCLPPVTRPLLPAIGRVSRNRPATSTGRSKSTAIEHPFSSPKEKSRGSKQFPRRLVP